MNGVEISPLRPSNAKEAAGIWNESGFSGEVLYSPIDENFFTGVLFKKSMFGFAAKVDGRLAGWIHAALKKRYSGETVCFLTALFVAPEFRNRGIGTALINAIEKQAACEGVTRVSCSSDNPVNISWLIPGTPGHDHNNAPGVDENCAGYGFLLRRGYLDKYHEVAMYMRISDYSMDDSVRDIRRKLSERGIYTGAYDVRLGYEYDEMCDRVGSEYWRGVLESEIRAWRENRPNDEAELWPDGIRPKGPRKILVATVPGHIIGFTGPIDLQKSGRGWFTGICTDPKYGKMGIATVLFNTLMREFIDEGASFCTLFTGRDNHAQKVYSRAGLRIAARWAVMSKDLA